MTNTVVPVTSIICMGISAILSFVIPVVLLIYIKRRHKANILPFFVGCGVMLVFALVLESLVHQAVFRTDIGIAIQNNIWLYALYGGLMAGLFEETGRLAAFKTILKRYHENDGNALMYGAGHGGFEAVAILGLTMIGNIVLSVLINTGMLESVPGLSSAENAAAIDQALSGITSAAPYTFLLGITERIFAIVMQISLSILVWFASKDKESLMLFPLAIIIHALVDGVTVVLSQSGIGMLAMEGAVGLMAVIVAMIAKAVWSKRNRQIIDEIDI